VRAKAAELLAKSTDASATPALVKALQEDANEVVRAAAAAALGSRAASASDPEALKALKEASTKDASALVKGEALKAFEHLSPATPAVATPAPGGYMIGDVYVELGNFTNTSKIADPALVTSFQKLLDRQLAGKGVRASAPPKGKKAITLAGSIQKIEAKATAKTTAVSLGISLTITREASLLGIISKEAAIEFDGKISSSEEADGRAEVLEALVPSVYEDVNKKLPKWK
jgi:HEAT repeat protein